jgi:hypothetical protein
VQKLQRKAVSTVDRPALRGHRADLDGRRIARTWFITGEEFELDRAVIQLTKLWINAVDLTNRSRFSKNPKLDFDVK